MADIVGLAEWEADLLRAAVTAPVEVRQVLFRGALNIKKDWQRRWSGIAHAPHIPRSIDYDIEGSPLAPEAQIGPNRELGPEAQGFLGAILEYGGIHNGPVPGGLPALDQELPRFERALADLSVELLDG